MDRFVSTFTNKIDAKGRVSIPAPFRAVLERDGYAHGSMGGVYCYPSLDAPALDAGGERLARKIDRLLAGLPDYSDERDELSVALYGDVQVLAIDGDGRIVLLESQPFHRGTQQYRLIDAATGLIETGQVEVTDMIVRQPTDADVPVHPDPEPRPAG